MNSIVGMAKFVLAVLYQSRTRLCTNGQSFGVRGQAERDTALDLS